MKIFRVALPLVMAGLLASCSNDDKLSLNNPFDSYNTNAWTNANFQLYPVPNISGGEQRLRAVSNIHNITVPVGQSGQSVVVAGQRLKSGTSPLWMIYFWTSGSTPKLTRNTYTGTNVVGNGASVNVTSIKNNFLYTLGDD
ncbi:MAG: hypothetical protein JNM63_10160, partial [Spirochaetia bacterium]|nr:hypothetical protein [Spirochaetia bacterium]